MELRTKRYIVVAIPKAINSHDGVPYLYTDAEWGIMVWDNPVSDRDVSYLLEVHVSNGVVPVSDDVVPVSDGDVPNLLGDLVSNGVVPVSDGFVRVVPVQYLTEMFLIYSICGVLPISNWVVPVSNGDVPYQLLSCSCF